MMMLIIIIIVIIIITIIFSITIIKIIIITVLRDTPHAFRHSRMHSCTHVSSAWGQASSSICTGSVLAGCNHVPFPMLPKLPWLSLIGSMLI